MPTTKQAKPLQSIYQLHIELQEIQPTVWRTLWVPGNAKLSRLHRVIQSAMGWTNSHLHEFRIAGQCYGMDSFAEEFGGVAPLDESRFTIGKVLSDAVSEFEYEYDFGDGWRHHIRVQHILPATEYNNKPVCLGGENACPPEDVGGPGGFEEFVQVMSDPAHEDHLDLWRWHGGPFDRRGFDISAVNARIRRFG